MKTESITLRPWLDSDAKALYKYASDPEVGPRAGWPPHLSEEESLEIIHTVFNNPTTWAIVWNETGEAIGAMGYGLLKTDDIHPPKTGISVHFSCSLP